MKLFLKNTLLFLLPLILLLFCLDAFTSQKLRETPDRRFCVWNDILKGQVNANVYIMGSSRAWVHYSPSIIDRYLHTDSYNLGMDGSGANKQIERYRICRIYNQKPDLIIQNVDCINKFDFTTQYELIQYYPFLYYREMHNIIFQEPQALMFYVPFIHYDIDDVKRALKVKDCDEDNLVFKGYRGLTRKWNNTLPVEDSLLRFCPDKRTIKMFDDFLENATKDSIKILFVNAPVYIERTKRTPNLQEYYELIDSFSTKYNIPFIDYTYNEMSYDSSYFYNPSHLNKLGAEKFSRMLADTIKKMNLIE